MSFISEAGQFSFTGNAGGAVFPVADNINILGSGTIVVTGTPLTGTLTISGGGVTGMTEHAIPVGNATGGLTSLAVGANGQTIMGSTAADPGWTSSPQFGGSVTALNDITSTAGDLVSIGGSLISRDATNTATGPDLLFEKVRVAATIVSGDTLGLARFMGYDGVGYISGAKITSTNSGTVAANRIAGDLKFYTHPDSVIALPSEPLLRMTINPDGSVLLADAYSTAATPSGTAKVSLIDSNGLIYGLAGTAGQILQGGTSPAFSTATYPSTVTKGDVLVASADNVVGVVAGATTSGYVLMANGALTAPSFQALPPSFSWSIKTTDLNPMVVDNGYIANKAGLLTFTLPATCAVGKTMRVTGMNTDVGWRIAQNANQIIHFNTATTTTGVAGYLESTKMHDSVELVCCVADLEFIVVSSTGNITVV